MIFENYVIMKSTFEKYFFCFNHNIVFKNHVVISLKVCPGGIPHPREGLRKIMKISFPPEKEISGSSLAIAPFDPTIKFPHLPKLDRFCC